jgi:hypothetical protein
MSKPTEADLRRAKDNLQRVVTDQQRDLGVPNPGGRVVDEFIGPILEKVARTDAATSTGNEGEPNGREPLEGVTVTELGSYDWNLRTDEIVARPGSYLPTAEDRLRLFVRFLLYKPEVNAAMLRIGRMCEKHTRMRQDCTKCERRETKLRELMRRCAAKYGYGQTSRKIVSVGK